MLYSKGRIIMLLVNASVIAAVVAAGAYFAVQQPKIASDWSKKGRCENVTGMTRNEK